MIDQMWALRCDTDECGERVLIYAGPQVVNANSAREVAARQGWRSRVIFNGFGREDFCPDHAPVFPENPTKEDLHAVADGEFPWSVGKHGRRYRELMVEHGLVVLEGDPFHG